MSNYKKFTTKQGTTVPSNIQNPRRRVRRTSSSARLSTAAANIFAIDYRQAVQNPVEAAEHAIQTSTDDRAKSVQQANAESSNARRRVSIWSDQCAWSKAVAHRVENFFGLSTIRLTCHS